MLEPGVAAEGLAVGGVLLVASTAERTAFLSLTTGVWLAAGVLGRVVPAHRLLAGMAPAERMLSLLALIVGIWMLVAIAATAARTPPAPTDECDHATLGAYPAGC